MHAVSLLFHDVYVADPRESGFASHAADRYKLTVRQFEAQLQTYMRLMEKRIGLLINFNSRLLKDGIKRIVL